MRIKREQSVCEWQGVDPEKPEKGSKLGMALETIGQQPINGLRHNPENGTNGWYIWCGDNEISQKDDNFFSPLCIEHIEKYLPEIREYLDLPSGYRFLINDDNYEDVWEDSELLL